MEFKVGDKVTCAAFGDEEFELTASGLVDYPLGVVRGDAIYTFTKDGREVEEHAHPILKHVEQHKNLTREQALIAMIEGKVIILKDGSECFYKQGGTVFDDTNPFQNYQKGFHYAMPFKNKHFLGCKIKKEPEYVYQIICKQKGRDSHFITQAFYKDIDKFLSDTDTKSTDYDFARIYEETKKCTH